MRINWKMISYLLVFLAGCQRGRGNDLLGFILIGAALAAYYFIENGKLSCDKREP